MSAETTTPVLDAGVAADADRARAWGWWAVVEHHVLRMRSYVRTMLITGIGSPVVYLAGLGAGRGLVSLLCGLTRAVRWSEIRGSP